MGPGLTNNVNLNIIYHLDIGRLSTLERHECLLVHHCMYRYAYLREFEPHPQ